MNPTTLSALAGFPSQQEARGLIHYLCSHGQQHLAGLRWLAGKIDASTVAQ